MNHKGVASKADLTAGKTLSEPGGRTPAGQRRLVRSPGKQQTDAPQGASFFALEKYNSGVIFFQ